MQGLLKGFDFVIIMVYLCINLIIMQYIFSILFICIYTMGFGQSTTYHKETNIIYTPNTDAYSKERCKLDFYYPTNQKDFITVIWFHGGGLTGGEKEIPEYLTNKNIAIVGAGYRLSPKAKVADIIHDAADAVKWTFDNVERVGGSKKNVVIAGMSAGAYLSLMLTLNPEYLAQRQINTKDIFGVVSFSAQTITHFTARKEYNREELQPDINALSPLYWVRKDIPRLLLLTGDRELEMMGRYEENAYLWRMLKLHGNKDVELFELGGYGHDMTHPGYPLLLRALDKWSKQ